MIKPDEQATKISTELLPGDLAIWSGGGRSFVVEFLCVVSDPSVDHCLVRRWGEDRAGDAIMRVRARHLSFLSRAGRVLAVQRLRPGAILPRRMTSGAAGLDLFASIDAPVVIPPRGWASIGTGISVAISPGFEGQVRSRSGLARSAGIAILNGVGTIDSDYRGEVAAILVNHGECPTQIDPGSRIAQLVICPICVVDPVEVDTLPATARGEYGFGSTGRF